MSPTTSQTRIEYAEQSALALMNKLKDQFPQPLKITHESSAEILGLTIERGTSAEANVYGDSSGQTTFQGTPFGDNAKLFMDNIAHWLVVDGKLYSFANSFALTRSGLELLGADFLASSE